MALARSASRSLRFNLGCYGLLLPTLVLLGVFSITPMLWAFSKSFQQFEIGGEAQWVGLRNYREIFTEDPAAFVALGNMLFLTAFAVFVRLIVPLGVAKLIISLRDERWRHLYRILFLAPIVVPLVATQLIWRGVIYGQLGLVNRLLEAVGLEHWVHGWLSEPGTALFALAFIGFPFVGGLEVLIYYAGLAAIPESVNDSAKVDGLTGVRKFFAIDVPLVLSQIRLIVALTIIAGVQSFETILILTRGGPGFRTMVPGLWMYFNAFSFQRMGYACAIGVLLFLMIGALTSLNFKFIKSTEEAQA